MGDGKYSDKDMGKVAQGVPGFNPDVILEINPYGIPKDVAENRSRFAREINSRMQLLGIGVETYRSMLLTEVRKAQDDIRDGEISLERGVKNIARLKEEISYLKNIVPVSEREIRKRNILDYLLENKKERELQKGMQPIVWSDVL